MLVLIARVLDAQAQSCGVTAADQEGPYYLPSMPLRTVMSDVAPSELFTYRGRVLDQGCCPLGNVAVEVWHANANGSYTFTAPLANRGVVRTAADGSFEWRSEFPGSYPDRFCGFPHRMVPQHVHLSQSRTTVLLLRVRVQADPAHPHDASRH